jgi:hypothetical protein
MAFIEIPAKKPSDFLAAVTIIMFMHVGTWCTIGVAMQFAYYYYLQVCAQPSLNWVGSKEFWFAEGLLC